jgi:hypothetical protein
MIRMVQVISFSFVLFGTEASWQAHLPHKLFCLVRDLESRLINGNSLLYFRLLLVLSRLAVLMFL